jgi:hypothetical protein
MAREMLADERFHGGACASKGLTGCTCGMDQNLAQVEVEAAAAPLPLDVEKVRQAMGNHEVYHRRNYAPHGHVCDSWIAAEYARLSASTGRSTATEIHEHFLEADGYCTTCDRMIGWSGATTGEERP